MLVALTIGHAGRPPYRDHGTSTGQGLSEVTMARTYVTACEVELWRLGHRCVVLSDGGYPSQWRRVNAVAADAYVNCHVNGGSARYGLVVPDHRATDEGGLALAQAVADELSLALNQDAIRTRRVYVRPGGPDTNSAPRDADLTEAWNTIKGAGPPALCFEPFFSRDKTLGISPTLLSSVGVALARGLDTWGKL